jgi:hypothetical protein
LNVRLKNVIFPLIDLSFVEVKKNFYQMIKIMFSNMKKFLIILSVLEAVEIKLRFFKNQQKMSYELNQGHKFFDFIFDIF